MNSITTKTELACRYCGQNLYCEIKTACEASDFVLVVYCDNDNCSHSGIEYEKQLSLWQFEGP
jgi:hypothetical protein